MRFHRCVLGVWPAAVLVLTLGLASGVFAAEPPGLQNLSPAEKARVQKLLEAAEKEGEVSMITNSMGPDVSLPLFEEFKKHYGLKNVKLKHMRQQSRGVLSILRKDISAQKYSFDIVQSGSAIFARQLIERNEMMKYWSPQYENFTPQVTGKAAGMDAHKGYYISSHINLFGIVWNTRLVKKDIKRWEDVLDPQFKGRIILADALLSASIVNVYGGLRKILPRSYFEQLAKMEPVFVSSHRTHVQKVVAGEKWLSVMTSVGLAYKDAAEGAPVKAVVPEGKAMALGYPFQILAHAKHPNAAKLWMDYLHSREGHLKYASAQGFSATVKNATVSPLLAAFTPPLEKLEVIPMEWDKIGPKQLEVWRAEYKEIFYGKDGKK